MFFFTASTTISYFYRNNPVTVISEPLLFTENARQQGYEITKRALDIAGAGILIIALLPVLLISAIAIRLSSRGPVLYSQTRLTQHGKTFTMFKFRTMLPDAEATSGAVWAQKNDNRVTPIGRFFRKSRIDELPQLFNVLRGDMSLIGPRPERPEFVAKLEREFSQFHKRLEVRAGISGLAQTTAGYADDFASYSEKLNLDLEYVATRGILLDMKLAIRTVGVVLTGRGAQ